MFPCVQYPGASQGEVPGRGTVTAGQGELRVLRAGEDVAATRRHHLAARQGLYHQTHHLLPQAEGLLRARTPTLAEQPLQASKG